MRPSPSEIEGPSHAPNTRARGRGRRRLSQPRECPDYMTAAMTKFRSVKWKGLGFECWRAQGMSSLDLFLFCGGRLEYRFFGVRQGGKDVLRHFLYQLGSRSEERR